MASKFWLKHKGLITSVISSTCLIGASAGVVFGVSAGTFKINYMTLNDADLRAASANGQYAYYSQNIKSQWNMDGTWNPNSQQVLQRWWTKLHNGAETLDIFNGNPTTDPDCLDANAEYNSTISDKAIQNRYKYVSMVIDGSTHSTMDRSFNQGLYNGIVNFIKNHDVEKVDPETEIDPLTKNCAKSYKPGGDNTTEFLNIFASVAAQYKAVCLAGFNHVTPLNAMGTYDEGTKRVKYDNPNFDKTAFLLIDGEVAKNQNVGSVLFRSDQPGFMVGIATSMYFLNNLNLYHDHYQDLSIGAYGGTAIPTVTIYMGGVQRGVEFFNRYVLLDGILRSVNTVNEKNESFWTGEGFLFMNSSTDEIRITEEAFPSYFTAIKNLVKYSKHNEEIEAHLQEARKTSHTEKSEKFILEGNELLNKLYDEYEVKMIKLGDGATHFSGSFASGDAIGITKQYLNREASAVIAVAGPQSLDSAQEIQNQNSKCIVIGVDSAMEAGDYQRAYNTDAYEDSTVDADGKKSPQKNNIIKFSAVKDMTAVTAKFSQLCAKGMNFDVQDVHLWRNPDTPESITYETEDSRIFKPTDFTYVDSEGKYLINAFEPEVDCEGKSILRIPEKDPNTGRTVDGVSENAFNPASKSEKQIAAINAIQTVVFPEPKGTEYVFSKNAFYNCKNITNIDLRNVSDAGLLKWTINENAFNFNDGTYSKDHGGRLTFNANRHITDNDEFVSKLNVKGGLKTTYFAQLPDPDKSICSIGYKTCGNIQNGLISISKAGWVPFIQAMSHVWVNSTTKFSEAWNEFAPQYYYSHMDEIPEADREEFTHQVFDFDQLNTFDQDKQMYKHYDFLMRILAEIMSSAEISFDPSMTVAVDADGHYVKATAPESMTIIDWLRRNMYFTC